MFIELWLDGTAVPHSHTRFLPHTGIAININCENIEDIQERVLTCLRQGYGIRAWLHPDTLRLLADDFSSYDVLSRRTCQLIDGVLSSVPPHTQSTQGIPIRVVYAELSQEICRRIEVAWQCGNNDIYVDKTTVLVFLQRIVTCLETHIRDGHYVLIPLTIEVSMLMMICVNCNDDLEVILGRYESKKCLSCEHNGPARRAHNDIVQQIRVFYDAHAHAKLQGTLKSPHNSPLSALCVTGLGLEHALLLVTKEMQWHNLTVAEAQALASCAALTALSNAPWTNELLYRLSTMQADAENRAVTCASEGYVYDDIIDAWIPQFAKDEEPVFDPGLSGTSRVCSENATTNGEFEMHPSNPNNSNTQELYSNEMLPSDGLSSFGQDHLLERLDIQRKGPREHRRKYYHIFRRESNTAAVSSSIYAPIRDTLVTTQRNTHSALDYLDHDEIDFLQCEQTNSNRTRRKVKRFDVAEEGRIHRENSSTRARNKSVRVFSCL